MDNRRTTWTETVLYYVLWAVSTFLMLLDIVTMQRMIVEIVSAIVYAIPRDITEEDPAYLMNSVSMFTWLLLVAVGLSLTIVIEYRLRRAMDTTEEASGADKEGGSRPMVSTALKIWAWQGGVMVVAAIVAMLLDLFA